MKLLNQYRAWRDARVVARALRKDAKAAQDAAAAELLAKLKAKTEESKGMRIRPEAIAALRGTAKAPSPPPEIKAYEPPKGVVPAGMAMDYDCTDYGYVNTLQMGAWGAGMFRGFPYLAMLMQQPEYRKITGTIAEEMTRKWIKLRSLGGDDKSDKIEKLAKALEKYKVRDAFRQMAEYDGFFGRGQLYVEVKLSNSQLASDNPEELKTLLLRDKAKLKKGSLIAFQPVEPVWTYPGRYESTNPLAPGFYRPSCWYVMGKEIHRSRLLTFVSRPVPDLLKASYNFSGLSLSQMAEPYVNNWLRTRDSVSDLLHSFSLSGIATDLGTVLSGGGAEQLGLRAQMFNEARDNRGLLLIDKSDEEYFQHDTSLSGLDKLQAQAQEQMSTPASIPLVKFFGITPSGLNASSDGEVRVFYDHIHAKQEANWREPLTDAIGLVQLSEFGDIDPDITFDFEPLWEPDATELAANRKTDMETDAIAVESSIITVNESRERLIADPASPYHSLKSNPDAKEIEEVLSEAEEARAAELLAPSPTPGETAE